MKYIRTKDGISKLDDDWALFCKDRASNKQADTIEELCDEFVYDFYGKHPRCYYSPNTKTWVDEENGIDLHIDFVKTIKGAIWTDKGLIYVAKMNAKGELELL